MNFQLSEEQLLLIDGFQKFLEREVNHLRGAIGISLFPSRK